MNKLLAIIVLNVAVAYSPAPSSAAPGQQPDSPPAAPEQPVKDKDSQWSAIGEWRVTHPAWTDIVTLSPDGSVAMSRLRLTGKWTLTTQSGTPAIILQWDRSGSDSVSKVGPDHFRGQTADGQAIDMRRGKESAALNAAPWPAPPDAPAPGLNPGEQRNILVNGNFELGGEGWELIAFNKKGTMAIDAKELRNGKATLRIDNVEGDHSFVRQMIRGKPNTRYRLEGYIKTANVKPVKGTGNEGAVLMVGMVNDASEPLQASTPWTRVSVEFTPKDPNEIRVGPSLGMYARPVTGTAWFSEISLIEIGGTEAR